MDGLTRRGMVAGAALVGLGGRTAVAQPSPAGGLRPEKLAVLTDPGRKAVASGDVPGVISLCWRRGELAMIDLAGLMDIEHKRPMQRDAIFGIASMTKPITVAAALTLVEDGKVKLDDPITKWAPEFASMKVLKRPDGPLDDTYPAPGPITIQQLMTHTSGFSYAFTASGPLAIGLMQKIGFGLESPLTPDQWMKTLGELPLAYAPGERFNYGHSIDVLGFIVGRAAGTSLREVMRSRLFEPLGMRDSDFWIPPEKRGRMATVYSSAAPGIFTPVTIGSWLGSGPPAYTSGGQGLISTADDYLAFARMLVRRGEAGGHRRVLKRQTVELMTTDRLTPGQKQPGPGAPDWRYAGFGFSVQVATNPAAKALGMGAPGAFGWGGAFGGLWEGDPAEDMVAIWLQHCLPGQPAPGSMPSTRVPGQAAGFAFFNAVYSALEGA